LIICWLVVFTLTALSPPHDQNWIKEPPHEAALRQGEILSFV
jgi:hypothetical protein